MTLWSVFATGLVAGGASCAAVQGGLLAGVVARRKGLPDPSIRHRSAASRKKKTRTEKAPPAPSFSGAQDLIPVGGFLAAKLVSHTLLGAALGLVGERVQVGFRAQAAIQILAGVVMLVMAADLLGFHGVRKLIPSAPASWTAVVRRRAKSSDAFAPAVLGFLTVLIPCGITLSMELLAIASGSAVTGALIMATFVLGTSPLFAALGYAFRRAGSALGGSLGKVAAAAVVVVGLVSINSGLVLSGSPVSFRRAPVAGPSTQAPPGSVEFSEKEAPPEEASAPVGQPDAPQVQILALDVKDTSYSPSSLKARAGVPTKLILTTNRTQGCTRAFVIPDLNLQKVLPESGKTEISLGKLGRGKLEFTCSMGMYSGEINAS